mgnify:CR=1 FL=1
MMPAKLTVELVPKPCWWSNLRSFFSPTQWARLRSMVLERASHLCEICGSKPSKGSPLHCHEIWSYNDLILVQELVGLQSLCPRCHEVKHLGHTRLMGNLDRALVWLAQQNNWNIEEATAYAALQFRVWASRSRHEWSCDLSLLKREYHLDPPRKIVSYRRRKLLFKTSRTSTARPSPKLDSYLERKHSGSD